MKKIFATVLAWSMAASSSTATPLGRTIAPYGKQVMVTCAPNTSQIAMQLTDKNLLIAMRSSAEQARSAQPRNKRAWAGLPPIYIADLTVTTRGAAHIDGEEVIKDETYLRVRRVNMGALKIDDNAGKDEAILFRETEDGSVEVTTKPDATAALAEFEKPGPLNAALYEIKLIAKQLFYEGATLATTTCEEETEEEDEEMQEPMRADPSPRVSRRSIVDTRELKFITFGIERIFDVMGVPDPSEKFVPQIRKERARKDLGLD